MTHSPTHTISDDARVPDARLAWAIKNADYQLNRATMDFDSFDEVTRVLVAAARELLHHRQHSQEEYRGWQPIETAPKDGAEFFGGRWYQGRFLTDTLRYYAPPGQPLKLIHSRYRHRMDASVWRPLPAPPAPSPDQAGETR